MPRLRPRHPHTPREEGQVTLTLISIGLADERDLSLRALEEARRCDALYAEAYTTILDTDIQRLSALIGKPVEPLPRSAYEESSEGLLHQAESIDVGGLCSFGSRSLFRGHVIRRAKYLPSRREIAVTFHSFRQPEICDLRFTVGIE